MSMPKTIAPLPRGHYWATPHAPFPLDGPNGHDEVFPGAHCVSDGKWVSFYKDGKKSGRAMPCMLRPISTSLPFRAPMRRKPTEVAMATAGLCPLPRHQNTGSALATTGWKHFPIPAPEMAAGRRPLHTSPCSEPGPLSTGRRTICLPFPVRISRSQGKVLRTMQT